MRCERIEPHLAAYLDGELDVATQREVEQHLKECRACREAARDMRLASAALTKWRDARPTVSLVEVVRKRIEEEKRHPERAEVPIVEVIRKRRAKRRGRWFTVRRLAVAASVLIVVGALWVAWRWNVPTVEHPLARRTREVGALAMRAESVEDVRRAGIALDGVVAELWSEARPSAEAIVPLEVVGTMMRTANDPAQAKEAGRLLTMMGEGGVAMRLRRGVDDALDGAGDCLVALFTLRLAAADETPETPDPTMAEATALERKGDLEGALKRYASARKPGADRLLVLRSYIHEANIRMKLGRAEDALQALARAHDMTKPDTFNRDVVEQLTTRAERAVALRKRIRELKAELLRTENAFDTLSEIGSLQVRAGNLKGARSTFNRLAADDQANRRAERLRARLLSAWCDAGMNRLDAAYDAFDKLVGDASGAANDVAILAQYERARVLHLKGFTAMAIRDYRKLAESDPDMPARLFAALKFQIGYIYLRDLHDSASAAGHFDALSRDAYSDQPFSRLAEDLLAEIDS